MLALLLVLAADTTGYWQQRVAYEISASLDEPTGVLTGRARIMYVNRSPDTLRDFYVHQYLNAFRPGSRWAAADAAEDRVRFQRLGEPDYAFERITASRLMGAPLSPDYPFAPDSTVAHWTLPRALAPGDTVTAEIEWQARPSTLARRQGRRGRRFDFAQWYPKVVVYDRLGWQAHPLYPAGEFYGEFATYDVTLDLPQDQVIGATGVPVEGDPGWERAKADSETVVDYQRRWYRATLKDAAGNVQRCRAVGAGRKCVRFYASDVHHFAFSLNPEYKYEQGRYDEVVVRVLYLPGDSATWGKGIAVERTVHALAWLDDLFGKFPWPQLTNVHRIEGGGTEFPMMVMDGSASLGLIVHEVGHNYTMGVLANNEWREGWLDEGFTSFQSGWFFEARGAPPGYPDVEADVVFWDVDRWSEPVSTVSERFRDFTTYNTMIYTKGRLFLEQLRYVVGDDAMRRILRTFYARWKLKHVDEAAFREVAEEISRQDLGWLFGQWLHGTPLIDYEIQRVTRQRLANGQWLTAVVVRRIGDGWMPLEIGDRRRIYARTTGQQEIERVEFTSAERPGRLTLDPRVRGHDWNMTNNTECSWCVVRGNVGKREWRVDNPVREVARRDRSVTAFLPVVWSNAWGGATVGLRARSNYLGRFDRGLVLGTYGLREGATHPAGFYFQWENPVRAAQPRTDLALAFWNVEGRAGTRLRADRSLRRHPSFGADAHAGFDLLWMATSDLGYLDRRLWDDAGTVEAGPWVSTAVEWGSASVRARLGIRVGVLYWAPGPGSLSPARYDVEGYGRGAGELSVRAPFVLGSNVGARVFGGLYLAESRPPRQRRIMVAGADPYETFENPLLRSRGALFARQGLQYHAPGGANLRGFRGDLGGRWAAGVNLELARPLFSTDAGVVRHVAPYGFVDLGLVDSLAVRSSPPGKWYTTLYDGGAGLATRFQVGALDWTVRVEFPLVVNRLNLAADLADDPGRLAFRWQVSLEPSF